MLRPITVLAGSHLCAADGEIGKIKEVYFDDEKWTVRYLIIDTGFWLPGRQVLISPIAVRHIDTDTGRVEVNLIKEIIKNSPDIDTHRPISRQRETEYFQYYGWPIYWAGADLWGNFEYPNAVLGSPPPQQNPEAVPTRDSHLRSSKEMIGYKAQAQDGVVGFLEDFLMDDETWAIRYLVIRAKSDTAEKNEKNVLLLPSWIQRISWSQSKVFMNMGRQQFWNSPQCDPAVGVDQELETHLLDYWERHAFHEADR